MYTLEDRMRAVSLYLKYGGHSAAVRRELGYPTKNTLKHWVREYNATGALHDGYRGRPPKYSNEQKQAAVDYYLEHGRSLRRSIQALGYPNRETLRQWLDEAVPDRRGLRSKRSLQPKVEFSREQKQAAVLDLCSKDGPAREVAGQYGVSRTALYQWKYDLLGKERPVSRPKRGKHKTRDDRDALLAKVESLKGQLEALEEQVYRLQLERDVLEVTAEILKKDQGADPKKLTNREKAAAIGALRERYPLNDLLGCLSMPKSSYFYHYAALSIPDKYSELRERTAFALADGRYGYRRIHAVLIGDGKTVSEKVVRRLMRDENLVVVGRRKRRYSAYKGESSPAVPNIIERDFHAQAPNSKWLTDLTEFPLPAGKVYLSPIIDCFDGMAVSWSIGTSPDAGMVNSMLDNAISTLAENDRPLIHSDRGSHYRWPGWIDRMKAAGLTRSMSKKGCSPDNAACEGFFGRLKNELFYGRSWAGVSIEEFIDRLDSYLHWYNEKRIKISLGGRSPMEYRQSLGYA
ncbi:MAG: IS3 family transposase [Bacillota bacterium]